MKSEDIVKEILDKVQRFNFDDIPDLDLYMDQVTTYINKKFEASKRQEDDKLLTKTMINNYTKSKLLPAPDKKKYSKDHILALGLIFFFKNVISISDVTTVMEPIFRNYFHSQETPLENLINNFIEFVQREDMSDSILNEFKDVNTIFEGTTSSEEKAKTLAIIGVLSYDMFIRKIIVERLIDSLSEENNNKIEE